jgi:hypothetical protein
MASGGPGALHDALHVSKGGFAPAGQQEQQAAALAAADLIHLTLLTVGATALFDVTIWYGAWRFMTYPHHHTHTLPQHTRASSVNTPHVAHLFICHSAAGCLRLLVSNSSRQQRWLQQT